MNEHNLGSYARLCKHGNAFELHATAAREYFLAGKAARDLDKLVEEGLREYEAGKCRKLNSLA